MSLEQGRAPAKVQRGDSDSPLSGLVAVIIALATLIGALAGFLQAEASNTAGDLRNAAEQLSLDALASSQSAQQGAQVELETFARWVEQRTRAGNALVASLYAGADPARAEALEREQQQWETVAAATLAMSDIDPAGEFGPDGDPTFPSRYFATATEDGLRLNALRDVANERASAVDQRAASYTAVLATIAVSLYLFGLTLAVTGRWLRLGFLGVGLALLGVGSLLLLQTALAPVPTANDEAAAVYARARVTSLTAHDTPDFEAAEAEYDRAIELRPSFARAYAERAGVIFSGASPQRSGFVSLAPPEALRRARADLDQALALGLETPQTLGDLGFYSFAEGIQSGEGALLTSSVDYSRRAIALDPGEPVYRYNLAVALVAAGRLEEARAAYRDAVARTLFVDTEPRQSPEVEESYLAGALTDLELVRRYRPDLEGDIRGLKEQIVGPITAQAPDPPVSSPATVADVELDVFPAEVQWQATVNGYDPGRDVISAQWYHQAPSGLGWAVIPELSLTETPAAGSDGRLFVLSPYLSRVVPPACLPPGQYRAEIYVNGRLAAQGEAAAGFADYDAFAARDLTMAFCRPPDWLRREDRLPGIVDGFATADGTQGVFGARFALPGDYRRLPDVSAQIADLTVQAFSGWFAGMPTYVEDGGTTADYFMGLSDTAWRWYDDGSGYVRVAAGTTTDGAVLVGGVHGPYDWFDGDEPGRILDSMLTLE